ncbi:MAG: PD-(D/E)XK nuclease family protein, partial [Bacteroidota bacterium]
MNKTFLEDLATKVFTEHQPDLHHVTVVFPNRRAGLFFQRYLSNMIEKPIWAPEVVTLEEFILKQSDLQPADPLTLIFELYRAFNQFREVPEPFERFYFWGEMLVKDFEDLDRYLVEPEKLFISVKNQKQLDEAFYFLDEEERKTIQQFWSSFLPDASPSQYSFLKTWEILSPVYEEYTKGLIQKGIAYTGLIYREVAKSLKSAPPETSTGRKYIFAGFNALTATEEVVMKHYVTQCKAAIYWDYDAYYFQDPKQEAGMFFRE